MAVENAGDFFLWGKKSFESGCGEGKYRNHVSDSKYGVKGQGRIAKSFLLPIVINFVLSFVKGIYYVLNLLVQFLLVKF